MTNFKGTKGKWEYLHIEKENGDYFKVMCNETSIFNITTRNQTHAEANAKLISCAPEMLEMLERILKELPMGMMLETKQDIKQLIKKATDE